MLFLLTGSFVFGFGQKESDLRKAEKFIENKQYSEATLILAKIMKEQPKLQKQAAELLRRIRSMRSEYNDLYALIVQVLFEEQNFDEGLNLIGQLEQLDVGPSALEDLRQSSDPTELTIYGLARYNQLQSDLSAYLEKGRYWEALAAYLPGLDINRYVFSQSDAPPQIQNAVITAVSDLERSISDVLNRQKGYASAVAELKTIAVSQKTPSAKAVSTAIDMFERLQAALDVTVRTVSIIDMQNSAVANLMNGKRDLYLVAVRTLLLGRESKKGSEGIRLVIDSMLSGEMESTFSAVETAYNAAYDSARRALDAGDFPESERQFARVLSLCGTGRVVADGIRPILRGSAQSNAKDARPLSDEWISRFALLAALPELSSAFDEYLVRVRSDTAAPTHEILKERYAFWSSFDAKVRRKIPDLSAIPQGEILSRLEQESAVLTSLVSGRMAAAKEEDERITAAEREAEMQRRRAVLLSEGKVLAVAHEIEERRIEAAERQRLAELKAEEKALAVAFEIEERRIEAEERHRLEELALERKALAAAREAELRRLASEYATEQRLIAEEKERRLRFARDEVERIVPAVTSTVNDLLSRSPAAFAYLEGTDQGDGIVRKYPDKALAVLVQVEKDGAGVSQSIAGFRTWLGSSPDYVLADPKVTAAVPLVDQANASLSELVSRLLPVKKQAESMFMQAKRNRTEGDLRLKEAEDAIQREQFETGRQKLVKAQDSYIASLASQDDPDLRALMDREILRLSSTITRAENAGVIRDVRKYITDGKSFYLQGLYERAEDSLLKAQARWSQTNTGGNSEIEYWLGFVKSALYVKSSREIPETHSLYSEMRQLLNLARESFNRGKALLEKGDRANASKYFDEAEAKVLQVKIPFPFNKDANILPLQILKLRNPSEFRTMFGERFRQAKETLALNPNDAYMSLKDLEEIDPAFPGLKDAIYAAEIALKMRVAPPDPKDLKESDLLYQQALRIFNQNATAQFPIALEQLAKAVEMNPENGKAIELKDRIMMTTGGKLSLVLSSTDQQEYRLAEDKFIDGKYIEALAIVERLLKRGSNDRYQPLILLKGRIESKI